MLPGTTQAMRMHGPGTPLVLEDVPLRPPAPTQVLIEVLACGVCRTDLHLLDGELPHIAYPITPGHEIVGRVLGVGDKVTGLRIGNRIGVPWLGGTCGTCRYCLTGAENLCDRPCFTGYTIDGGYARHALADERYCLAIPDRYSDAQAAPLLCAGLIGYRAYRAAGAATNIGLYGFGAAAHLLVPVARWQERRIFALTRPGDTAAQDFARQLGAVWAGGSDELPPEPLDAAIIFAAVGSLVPAALNATRKGGRVICAGIHMSEIPAFPYRLLWGERSVSSVANLTRADGREFMRIAAEVDLAPAVLPFDMTAANEALAGLRDGRLLGAAVLINHR